MKELDNIIDKFKKMPKISTESLLGKTINNKTENNIFDVIDKGKANLRKMEQENLAELFGNEMTFVAKESEKNNKRLFNKSLVVSCSAVFVASSSLWISIKHLWVSEGLFGTLVGIFVIGLMCLIGYMIFRERNHR